MDKPLWPLRVSSSLPWPRPTPWRCRSCRSPAACRPAPGHAVHIAAGSVRVSNSLPAGRVPHLRRSVLAARSPAACRPGSRPRCTQTAAVALQGQHFLARWPRPTPSPSGLSSRSPAACRPGSRPRYTPSLPWPVRVSTSLPARRVPHLRRLVLAARSPAACRPGSRPRYSRIGPPWPFRVQQFLARWPRPTPSPSGHRSRSPAACRPGSRPRSYDLAAVALQGQQFLPAGRVPHLRRLSELAVASRLPSGLQATLLASPVALQGQHFLPAGRVPHLRRLVIARGRQPLAVRAPGHASHPARRGPSGSASLPETTTLLDAALLPPRAQEVVQTELWRSPRACPEGCCVADPGRDSRSNTRPVL